jgi:hypothetical protein
LCNSRKIPKWIATQGADFGIFTARGKRFIKGFVFLIYVVISMIRTWMLILIIVFIIYIICRLFQLFFLMGEIEGKDLKRNLKARMGLFIYYMIHNVIKPRLKFILKDTFFVLFDSILLSFLVMFIISADWLFVFWTLFIRLLFVELNKNKIKVDRNVFIKVIQKDLPKVRKSWEEWNKKFPKKIKKQNKS